MLNFTEGIKHTSDINTEIVLGLMKLSKDNVVKEFDEFLSQDVDSEIKSASLALCAKEGIYMVRSFDSRPFRHCKLEMPGGGIKQKKGETIIECAFREFEEETGKKVDGGVLLFRLIDMKTKHCIVVCSGNVIEGVGVKNPLECEDYGWVSWSKLKSCGLDRFESWAVFAKDNAKKRLIRVAKHPNELVTRNYVEGMLISFSLMMLKRSSDACSTVNKVFSNYRWPYKVVDVNTTGLSLWKVKSLLTPSDFKDETMWARALLYSDYNDTQYANFTFFQGAVHNYLLDGTLLQSTSLDVFKIMQF